MKEVREVKDVNILFEKELHRLDQANASRKAAEAPYYPMLVIFLGEDTEKAGFPILASRLQELWPQYERSLLFFSIRTCAANPDWHELRLVDEETEDTDIQDQEPVSELIDRIQSLYDEESPFKQKHNTMVYYVMCTAGRSVEENSRWYRLLGAVKKRFADCGLHGMADMLMLLLDESLQNQRNVGPMRGSLGKYYEEPHVPDADNILLLSNARQDGTIDSRWDAYYRMLAEMMALSNNKDFKFTKAFFSQTRRIITASCAVDGKQTDRIAKAAVGSLVKGLGEAFQSNGENGAGFLSDEELKKRLGIGEDGYLDVIHDFTKRKIAPMLPKEEELEYFPRGDLYEEFESAPNEFNDQTMGAWTGFLKYIMEDAKKKAKEYFRSDSEPARRYAERIRGEFTNRELVALGKQRGRLRSLLKPQKEFYGGGGILEAAGTEIQNKIAEEDVITGIFFNIIDEQIRKAETFMEQWDSFVKSSRKVIRTVEDEEFEHYYGNSVRNNFLARNLPELLYRLDRMSNMGELEIFFERAIVGDGNVNPAKKLPHREEIPGILASDPAYAASFEEELRLRTGNDSQRVMERILEELTVSFFRTYLRLVEGLPHQYFNVILMDTSTDLCRYLKENYNGKNDIKGYYYNTGDSSRAILLMLYEVEAEKLFDGKEA